MHPKQQAVCAKLEPEGHLTELLNMVSAQLQLGVDSPTSVCHLVCTQYIQQGRMLLIVHSTHSQIDYKCKELSLSKPRVLACQVSRSVSMHQMVLCLHDSSTTHAVSCAMLVDRSRAGAAHSQQCAPLITSSSCMLVHAAIDHGCYDHGRGKARH